MSDLVLPAPDLDLDRLFRIRAAVHDRVIGQLGLTADQLDSSTISELAEEVLDEYLLGRHIHLDALLRERLLAGLLADILGYGPLDALIEDDDVTDIMVNGHEKVYVERRGHLERTTVRLNSEAHLMQIIKRIVTAVGRRVDETSPMCDARLPNGSRVNAIIPPLAVKGPALTIRKFRKVPLRVADLIANGTLTQRMAEFLEACVAARLNIVVAGGGASGKTTTLNVLSSFIPPDERIVTVEDGAELQLQQRHVIRLEARPPNVEGKGAVSIRELVINALRMRPDRIVVGDVRSGEALDMLQAMNSGHDGSLTTVHANTPKDTLSRLETLVLMAGMNLPSRAIRDQIASAIHLIVHQSRFRDGSRKVAYISEIVGMKGGRVAIEDIFVYQQRGYEDGRVVGGHQATGAVPRCLETLAAAGLDVPIDYFRPEADPAA